MPASGELGMKGREHVRRRDIEVGGRADVEHERARRVRRGRADERHDLVLGDIGVDERQWDVRAQHEEARDRLGRRVPPGVGVDRRSPRDPPEDGDVRPARLVQDRQQ